MKLNRLNGLLARIANRMESARLAEAHAAVCASVDPSATLHPTASIENLCRDPNSIVIGAHTHVRGQLLTFWNGGSIRIGKWCYVGEASRIWSQASISIGDHVMIAHLVDIHDTNSHPIDWHDRRLDSEAILAGRGYHLPTQTVSAPIVIEDDVWIGFKAAILKGVRVGRGAIVASAAVVTKDVDPWTIVAGNPAKVVEVLEPLKPGSD